MKSETNLPQSALIDVWRDKPQKFFQDVLGVEKIWRLQDELLSACPRAIKEHKHIYIASGHGLGKDWTCGGIALWFLYCYGPSIVILTGPTDRQVKKVMWGETMAHYNRMSVDLGGKAYTDPYLEIRKEDWYLLGFTTKESGASRQASGGKFQGFHAPNVCVIVTEAQAVEDDIYDQIDAVTTNENVLVIFLANPTRASGRFAKGLRDKNSNIVFNFSCLENPNYVQRKTVIPGLCSYEWIEDKRIKWGENDPRWQGRVLGIIPTVSINNVFSQADVNLGLRNMSCPGKSYNNGVSIDVAGEGVDENVFYSGKRGMVKHDFIRNIMSPSEKALKAVEMCKEVDGNFIIVDSDGLGVETVQELRRIPDIEEKYHIIKFHGSKRLVRKIGVNEVQYANVRALAMFTALKRLQEGLATIPNDDILIEELLEVKWFENERSGLIQIEDNADLKERLGRSPDRMMAWVMLQYGFSLDLEPIARKVVDAYAHVEDDLDYNFNPATV